MKFPHETNVVNRVQRTKRVIIESHLSSVHLHTAIFLQPYSSFLQHKWWKAGRVRNALRVSFRPTFANFEFAQSVTEDDVYVLASSFE